MERIVYCPSADQQEEAEAIAVEWNLPIQIGESGATSNLEFDRSVVQVVNIPTIQHLFVSHKIFKAGKTLRVEYIDEFDDVSNVVLRITLGNGSSEVIKPDSVYDGCNAVFTYRAHAVGKLIGKILDEEGVLAEFECDVKP